MAEACGESSSDAHKKMWREVRDVDLSRPGDASVFHRLLADGRHGAGKLKLLQCEQAFALVCVDISILELKENELGSETQGSVAIVDPETTSPGTLTELIESSLAMAEELRYFGLILPEALSEVNDHVDSIRRGGFERECDISFGLGEGKDLQVRVFKRKRSRHSDAEAIRQLRGSIRRVRIGEGPDNLKGREDWFTKRHGGKR